MALTLLLATGAESVFGSSLDVSTYIAGTRSDRGVAVALAPDGSIVIAGTTASPDFPLVRPLQDVRRGGSDAFVVKLDPSGTRIEFATYFGGDRSDWLRGMALDRNGDIYLVGSTLSNDFPLVGALRNERQDVDGFLAKLSNDGQQLLFSTFFGGPQVDGIEAIAVERPGVVFVTGVTNSSMLYGMPPINDDWGAYVARVVLDDPVVDFISEFGGSNFDLPTHIGFDGARESLWIAGLARSSDFPLLRPLRDVSGQLTFEGGFTVRYSTVPDVPVKRSSSLLPGAATAFGVDRKGRAHVALARADRKLGGYEEFAAECPEGSPYLRLQPNGSGLQLWHCLPFTPSALATDKKRRIYFTARTGAEDLVLNPVQAAPAGKYDVYVVGFFPGGARPLFATYLGGRADDEPSAIAVSRRGKRILVTGLSRSTDFPIASALQPIKPGGNRVRAAFLSILRP